MIRERLTAKMTFIKKPRRIAGIVGKRQTPPGRGRAKPWEGTRSCAFTEKQGEGWDPMSREGNERKAER